MEKKAKVVGSIKNNTSYEGKKPYQNNKKVKKGKQHMIALLQHKCVTANSNVVYCIMCGQDNEGEKLRLFLIQVQQREII